MNTTSLITNHADGEGVVSRNARITAEGVKILKKFMQSESSQLLVPLLILLRRSKLMQHSLAISNSTVKWKLKY